VHAPFAGGGSRRRSQRPAVARRFGRRPVDATVHTTGRAAGPATGPGAGYGPGTRGYGHGYACGHRHGLDRAYGSPYSRLSQGGDETSRCQLPYTARDIGYWGAFGSVLAAVGLLVSGCPLGSALSAGAALAAVTAVCAVLLRLSERAYAPDEAEALPGPEHRGRHGRTGAGAHRGGRRFFPHRR